MTDDAPDGTSPRDELPPADRALLDELAAAMGARAASDDLVDRCQGLLAWLDVDAELAELLETSTVEATGTRGGEMSAGGLEFEVADGSYVIEVRVTPDGLRGTVHGERPATVALRRNDGSSTPLDLDAGGDFHARAAGSGSARIELVTSADRRICTDWFVI